jgi:hypothetical protein
MSTTYTISVPRYSLGPGFTYWIERLTNDGQRECRELVESGQAASWRDAEKARERWMAT